MISTPMQMRESVHLDCHEHTPSQPFSIRCAYALEAQIANVDLYMCLAYVKREGLQPSRQQATGPRAGDMCI